MYEKALVPLDGSEFARAALAQVPRLSPRAVVLVAVVESVAHELARQTGVVADVPVDVAEEVEATALSERRRELREAEQQLRKRGWEGAITQVVRRGKPGPQIVALASELSCDVIVMATHGRTGIRRAVLGSVADHVVSQVSDVAVLLVRPADAHTPSAQAS